MCESFHLMWVSRDENVAKYKVQVGSVNVRKTPGISQPLL